MNQQTDSFEAGSHSIHDSKALVNNINPFSDVCTGRSTFSYYSSYVCIAKTSNEACLAALQSEIKHLESHKTVSDEAA